MSAKRSSGNRALASLASIVAAFGARKVIHFAWKRVTGKEPPEHPEDPQVALGEAVAWGLVIGAGVHTARMLASRAAAARSQTGEQPSEPAS